jgi:hypothetical protein
MLKVLNPILSCHPVKRDESGLFRSGYGKSALKKSDRIVIEECDESGHTSVSRKN